MTNDNLWISYGDEYLDWQLGAGHPTNPERALIATKLIEDILGKDAVNVIAPSATDSDIDKLLEVHSADYVSEVLDYGISGEWRGKNLTLGQTALSMFSGTARLVEAMLRGDTKVAFNPQGAKHHAGYDYSSGFCVFNDMAWAAKCFSKFGLTPMYIDWDAHHGDGVENLLWDTDIVTCSIHQEGIFPGTGNAHDAKHNAYNWPLESRAGNFEFASAMRDISDLASAVKPDVILLATGADAHVTDPLSTLEFEVSGYREAATVISDIATRYSSGRVLIGGAGGYQPHTYTPEIWATVVSTIYAGVTSKVVPV